MITTSRLVLRPFGEDDLEAFAALNGDPRVNVWLGGPIDKTATQAVLARSMAQQAEHGFSWWAAELRATGALVGMCGLSVVGTDLPAGPGVEIGWRFVPEVWGLGLATEAAAATLAWAAEHLPGQEIIAFTAQTNLKSQAVMRRIGMAPMPERDFDHPRLAQDHPLRRHVVFAAPQDRSRL